jgi:hypothetical protein
MDLFHKLIDLIDRNSERIPEGDYVELCNVIRDIRRKVQPPSFLIDQNEPMTYIPTSDGQPPEWFEDSLPSDPDTAAANYREQLHQQWRELSEEVMYPGLNQFLQELHEEWTDETIPIDDHVTSVLIVENN